MSQAIVSFVARPFVALWLRFSQFSWRRLTVANDSPHVHAPGANPDRILIAGDGASAGVGVRTHDLGLPGYLARNISAATGRATDVDIVVTTSMTASSCLDAVAHLTLSRFDAIILSLGANESLDFLPIRRWKRELAALLDTIETRAPAATACLVLSIPVHGAHTRLPRALAWAVNRHIRLMNAATQALTSQYPQSAYLQFDTDDRLESAGAHTYENWAAAIAPGVCAHLEPRGKVSTRVEKSDEQARLRAVQALDVIGTEPDPALARLTTTAKQLFDMPTSEVTFLDRDRWWLASDLRPESTMLKRRDAFCDTTIRRTDHFVIEDTALDPRYANNPLVVGKPWIRFYAGYPMESPDGQRVGAFCIMDTQPRSFSHTDAQLLRQLAHQAQSALWPDR